MNWKTTYETLKSFHDAAYKKIEEGIKYEGDNKKAEAAESYEGGLDFLQKAFEMQVECPPNPDLSWEKACVMLQKMKKSKKEVESRLSGVKQAIAAVDLAPPPSYEEAIRLPSAASSSTPSPTAPRASSSFPDGPSTSQPQVNGDHSSANNHSNLPSSCERPTNPEKYAEANRSYPEASNSNESQDPITYAQLNDALNTLKLESEGQSAKIIYTCNNVEVYYITPEGNVSATKGTDRLCILNILRIDNETPQFILKIGDWIYPLMPGVSPYMLTNYGAFIFPNTISEIEGEAIGVIVPPEAREQLMSLLEDILHPPEARPRALSSEAVSTYIEKGASYVSSGLIKGAEKAGLFLNVKTPKLIERLAQSPDPTGKPVNPNVAAGLKTARNVTGTAANVSGFILSSLGTATKELGTYLAPHIHKGGSKLLSRTTGLDSDSASEKMNSFMNVASSAVEGIATVSTGLETASSILGKSLTSNTVKVVEHKYGEPTGRATEDALYTVGHTITVSSNMQGLSAKGLAKKSLKNAGKGALKGFSNQVAFDNHHNLPSSSQSSSLQPMYPSLSGDQSGTSQDKAKSL